MDKALQMIGMAKRAGKLRTGQLLCEKAVKSGEAKLVVIASDASDNTKKSLKNTCAYYGVDVREYSDMDSLGTFSGGGQKSAAAVTDNNFAKAVLDKMNTL